MLKNGDIISASYVGYQNGEVKYDGYQKSGYVITLNMLEVEKITIYGRKETRKAFRTIQHRTPAARASDFTFRFVFDINGKSFCRGDFYHYFNSSIIEDVIRAKVSSETFEFKDRTSQAHNRMYAEFGDNYAQILDDKQNVATIKEVVMPMLQDVFYTASRLVATDLMYIEQSGTSVRMTAEKGKVSTFLLSREGDGNAYNKILSSTVFVDVDTLSKNVVESRMTITCRDGNLKLIASYANYDVFRYPTVIEATYTLNDGTEYLIDIYDTRMTYKDKAHIFKKATSVDIWDIDNELLKEALLIRQGPKEITGPIPRVESSVAKLLYKALEEEVAASSKLPDLLWRERLEMLALINYATN